MIDKLPNLPSEILEVALRDLEVVEKMPGVRINMSSWLTNASGKCCEVCHAGAVMINSLGCPADTDYFYPHNYDPQTQGKLHFIDRVRKGHIRDGLDTLVHFGVIEIHAFPAKVYINKRVSDAASKYIGEYYKEEYKTHIRETIKLFKEHGL